VFTAVKTTAGSATTVYATTDRILWQDSNTSTIGPLISPAGFTAANQQSLLEAILNGGSGGSGTQNLGGVDRSTVAVIGQSQYTGGGRPQMIYFGADDGMLHAVCGDNTAPCTLGAELWAFVPRVQLSLLRLNTQGIQGSPRVVDAFDDWDGTGVRRWATILTFHVGTSSSLTAGNPPAIYAIEVTNPTSPRLMWEYTIPNIAARDNYDLGVGVTLAMGVVQLNGTLQNLIFAETTNGGCFGLTASQCSAGNLAPAGVVVTAINARTGVALWQTGYTYNTATPYPRVAADLIVPNTGVPGGAVIVDKTGQGFVTDLVYADLFGDVWIVDPTTGTSRYTSPTRPLFKFTTDYHPIGAVPAIYSNGNAQFAVIATGGYADPVDSNWHGTPNAQQYALAIALNAPNASVPLNETSGTPNIPFKINLGPGENAYSQPTVVGTQVFVTTDTADVNASSYGTVSPTGHVYGYDYMSNTASPTLVVAGGASSVANAGTNLYASSSNEQQQLMTGATTTVGPKVNSMSTAQMVRKLWLRTQ
jgi:hypothetical protein